MTNWEEVGWVTKKNIGDCREDGEENEKTYQNCDYWEEEMQTGNVNSSSSSFSLSASAELGSGLSRQEQKSAAIAACFLKDYEGGQPPTLSNNFADITRRQLLLYRVKHSFHWQIFGLSLATIFLFIPSFNGRFLTFILHTCSILVFATDLYMKDQFFDDKYRIETNRTGRLLFHAMKIFLYLMSLQTILELFSSDNSVVHAFTLAVSVFKPIVFFYQSKRARDALEALIRISKKLLRVILIEMFLILVFATVACRLYYEHESFRSLPQSWLSLFACKFVVHRLFQSVRKPSFRRSHYLSFIMHRFLHHSVHHCGKSKYLDACIQRIAMECSFLRYFYCRQYILFAFFGTVRSFSSFHPICKRSSSKISLG
jgi:hypothetical protein